MFPALYGNSASNTPLTTPRTPRTPHGIKYSSPQPGRALHTDTPSPLQRNNVVRMKIPAEGLASTAPLPDDVVDRAQSLKDSPKTAEKSPVEEMADSALEGDAPRRRQRGHKRHGNVKNKENVPDDTVVKNCDEMDCEVTVNGMSEEEPGVKIRERCLRRSKTDCFVRREKALSRTKSASWSQKFLIGPKEV